MTKFSYSLGGYAHAIHQRDGFKCRYCGLDGIASFDNWLTLCQDHLLPNGHPDRENPDYIVTSCNFCNVAENRYFEKARKLGIQLEGKSPDELVAERKPYVQEVRKRYYEIWKSQVRGVVELSDSHTSEVSTASRRHGAFLNSYSGEDERLYEDDLGV